MSQESLYITKSARTAQRWGMAGVLLAAITLFLSVWLIARTENEGNERRNQTCLVFEGAYAEEVKGLKDVYQFLLDETPEERKSTLSRFIIRELPQSEAKARSDSDNRGQRVPDYCDKAGIGRAEPDPKVPQRPKAFKKLIP